MRVCDAHGRVLPNVISIGAGTENTSEYQSLIYYHEDKPKWSETFKVDVPIEDFYNAHLRVSMIALKVIYILTGSGWDVQKATILKCPPN